MNQNDATQARALMLSGCALGAVVAVIAGAIAGAFADFGTTPQAYVIAVALLVLLGLVIWVFKKYFIKAIGGPTSLGGAVCGALVGVIIAGGIGWATGFQSWAFPMLLAMGAIGSACGAQLTQGMTSQHSNTITSADDTDRSHSDA